MARIVVAMSGGVDSSVAALLLRQAGHEVIGLFMRHGAGGSPALVTQGVATQGDRSIFPAAALAGGELDGGKMYQSRSVGSALAVLSSRPERRQGCCSASDAHDARRVADALGIAFYAIDFQAGFERIIDYFVDEYTAGRTPNPCVMCNNWLKFGTLLEYADGVGAEYIATGHHARIAIEPGREPALLRGRDAAKDQSYVLFGIGRAALRRVLFPVGDFCKEDIRRLGREHGLRVADKPDSQEICFVPDGDHADLVRRRRGAEDTAGEIVTAAGVVVGRHEGLEGFTVGQRRGLGVARGRRQFVLRIERDSRRVVIGDRDELAATQAIASRTNWLIDEPRGPLRCQVKIRSQGRPVEATVRVPAPGQLEAEFAAPQYGIPPGQALVCYDSDRVLGGGWLEAV